MSIARWLGSILLIALLTVPTVAGAQSRQDPLANVSFEQRLGAQVPLDLSFVDDEGRPVRLGNYFGTQPVVLTLGYYECPMLCSLVRNGLVEALNEVRLTVGSDFQVISVSIDPRETPMNAANTRAAVVSRYNRPEGKAGWHFLTGAQESITSLAEAVGFKYFYDERIDQYAHAAGILVLTPEGRLARYFYGIEFNPSDVRLGIVEASGNKIGTPVDQLLLLCYQFDPATGTYTGLVLTLVRAGGILTVIVLLASLYLLSRGSGRPGAPGAPSGHVAASG
ncbi:MAG: SCO family protein [Chloroflexaceae bacterium]